MHQPHTQDFFQYFLQILNENRSDLNSTSVELDLETFASSIQLEKNEYAYTWDSLDQKVDNFQGFKNQLGYSKFELNTEFVTSKKFIHPDDYHQTMFLLAMALDGEHMNPSNPLELDYKLTYRVKKKNCDYTLITRKINVISRTDNGIIRANLSRVTDIGAKLGIIQTGMCIQKREPFIFDEITGTFSRQDAPLTSREKDVLELLCKGLSSKMIALELSIAKNTVDNFRKKLLKKTKSANTAELVQKALLHSWI